MSSSYHLTLKPWLPHWIQPCILLSFSLKGKGGWHVPILSFASGVRYTSKDLEVEDDYPFTASTAAIYKSENHFNNVSRFLDSRLLSLLDCFL